MQATLVCRALQRAIALRQPAPELIVHSARGTQYASAAHQALLVRHGLIGRMSRKGNDWANALMERFFLNLKIEPVWPRDDANHAGVMSAIADLHHRRLQQRASALQTRQLATQCFRAAIANQSAYQLVRNNLTRAHRPVEGSGFAARPIIYA